MKNDESAKKPVTQKLSKDERSAKDVVELAFQPHEGKWMNTAKRLLQAYNGCYYNSVSNHQRFTVNSIFSLVNLLLPNLIFNRPYVRCSPKQAKYFKELPEGGYLQIDNNRAAEVREAALNHKYQQIRAIQEQRLATQDSFFYGFGITKVGYSFETISEEDKDYLVKDSPFLKRVNPKDFGWHPLATGLDDSRFLVHRTLTTLKKLKDSKKYKQSLIDQITPSLPEYLQAKADKYPGKKVKSDFCMLYEVHDQEDGEIYTFGGEGKILLDKFEDPYDFNGPHFQMIRFAHDGDNFEGIPFLAMVEDECIALNEIVTLIVQHFRKFPGTIFYNIGSMDDNDVERIRNSEQGSIVGLPNIEDIKMTNPLSMGQEYFGIVQLLQNLTDRILGIPDFQRPGQGGSTRRSATEAANIYGDATIRRQYYLNIVKEFIIDGVSKLGKLQQQFQDKKEEICASGDLKGIPIEYDKTDIQGDFDFDFDVDELLPYNEAQAASMNQLLTTLASQPILNPIIQSLDPVKMAKVLFRAIGRNLESMQKGDIETAAFIQPDVENKMARRGDPMPAPKKGEPHDKHIKEHTKDLLTNGQNEQILEHVAEHVMLKNQEEGPVMPEMPPMPPMSAGGVPGAPSGPSGPQQLQ